MVPWKICIGRANEIPAMRSTNIPGSFVRWSYVPLANARQISRQRRRRWRRTRRRSILSRRDSWRELPVPGTDIYRVRSWHNRERGSTKKIDGRDFTASYHSNTGGRRAGGGNDGVEAERTKGRRSRRDQKRTSRKTQECICALS